MAMTGTNLSTEPRAFSLGPIKIQLVTFSVANADTSGTLTFDRLTNVFLVVATGLTHTAAPTYSGNVATFTFADPTATRYGQAIAFGR